MAEFRIGLPRLLRSPGYVAAVLSLATFIAVCVAAFSLVNVVVFREVRLAWRFRQASGVDRGEAGIADAGRCATGGIDAGGADWNRPQRSAVGIVGIRSTVVPPVLRATRIDPIHARCESYEPPFSLTRLRNALAPMRPCRLRSIMARSSC